MQILFILFSIFGSLYFLFRKSGADYYTIAFFSAVIYFLPGFFGYTSYHINGVWIKTEIVDGVYLVYLVVLLSIFLFSCFSRLLRVRCGFPCIRDVDAQAVLWALTFIVLLSMIVMFFTSGFDLFNPDKNIVMEAQNRSFVVFESAICCGSVLAYYIRRRLFFAFYLFCFGLYFYIGFRSVAAVSFVSILALMLSAQKKRLIAELSLRRIVVIFLGGLFIFSYKGIGYAVKDGAWDIVFRSLGSVDFYLDTISHSEPFVTQEILNGILRSDYSVSVDSLLSVGYQFMLFADKIGVDILTFNDQFQEALYPGLDYGMASNIWAQMFSIGSWPLLLLFLIVFNVFIYFFNLTLRSESFLWRVCCAPIFVYFVFYIHRNDLAYQLNLEKRLAFVLMFSLVLAWLISRNGGLSRRLIGARRNAS